MTFRIPSCFAVLMALAAFACSSSPAATSNQANSNKDPAADAGDENTGDENTGDDDDKASSGDAEPGEEEDLKDYMIPFSIHTGFVDASHKYQVPLETDLDGTLTWTVADSSIATIEKMDPPPWYEDFKKDFPDKELQFAMLTTKKAGSTTVKVSNGSKDHESPLEVVAYTAAQISTGQKRYKTGEGTAERRPCASCHETDQGPPHDPAWVSEVSDDEILHSVQTGSYEWDGKTYELNDGNHKWNLKEDEKKGILAYLRSLNPADFTEY